MLGLGDVYLGAPVATPLDPRHRLVTTKYNPARTWTAENSVGIGGAYLCIYGMEGPGGYQFVGRTVQVWNRFRRGGLFAENPWALRFFDRIEWYPVSADELLELRAETDAGRGEFETIDGTFAIADYEALPRRERRLDRRLSAAPDARVRARRRSAGAPRANSIGSTTRGERPGRGRDRRRRTAPSRRVCAVHLHRVADRGRARQAVVSAGDKLMALEAMKMESPVVGPDRRGRLRRSTRQRATRCRPARFSSRSEPTNESTRPRPQTGLRPPTGDDAATAPRSGSACATGRTRLDEAAAIDARVAAGESLPLAGPGRRASRTTSTRPGFDDHGGCAELRLPARMRTRPRSARLRANGAVVIGKTNLDQFATGLVGTRSPYGAVRNAWDPERISGGSSSGSAVAVALGIVDLALGTDTAGSGRVPAALNGIVGVKPTRGLVPATGVVPGLPHAWTASPSSPATSLSPAVRPSCSRATTASTRWRARLRRWPHARSTRLPAAPPRRHPHRARIWRASPTAGRRRSTRRSTGSPPPASRSSRWTSSRSLEAAALLYDGAFVAERYAAVGAHIDAHRDLIGPDLDPTVADDRPRAAHPAPPSSCSPTSSELDRLGAVGRAALDGCDALLTPTTTWHPTLAEMAADPIGANSRMGRFTNFANLLDMCSLADPRRNRGGLPFGVMLTARRLPRSGARAHRRAAPRRRRSTSSSSAPTSTGQPLNGQLVSAGGSFVGSRDHDARLPPVRARHHAAQARDAAGVVGRRIHRRGDLVAPGGRLRTVRRRPARPDDHRPGDPGRADAVSPGSSASRSPRRTPSNITRARRLARMAGRTLGGPAGWCHNRWHELVRPLQPNRPGRLRGRPPTARRSTAVGTRSRSSMPRRPSSSESGFSGTSTRAIADRVGIRQQSLYYHFAGKDEILVELLSGSVRPSNEFVQQVESRMPHDVSAGRGAVRARQRGRPNPAAAPRTTSACSTSCPRSRSSASTRSGQSGAAAGGLRPTRRGGCASGRGGGDDEARLGDVLIQLAEVVIQLRRDGGASTGSPAGASAGASTDDDDSTIAASCLRVLGLSTAQIASAREEADAVTALEPLSAATR